VTRTSAETAVAAARESAGMAGFDRLLRPLNRIIVGLCCLSLIAAALVLTESVIVRYFFHETTDWQNETCVMLLVAATFLSAAYVQDQRGHIGIEALAGVLPARLEWIRGLFIDSASLVFCAFFAWKSWVLAWEAWVEGTVTDSTFAPPLWIPYMAMALGMTLLSVQILAQLADRVWKHKA
jgi:TRAP-type C4-dicarboxylate transport system permease small subunit